MKNLQQIPIKVGGLIRNAFISDEGRLLASLDFSQQELRVLAHVSKDPVLLGIYRDGKDVHSMTAVGMWNRKHPDQQVSYEDFEYRRGMSPLFQDAKGDLDEAKLNDVEYVQKVFDEGHIKTTDLTVLKNDILLGIQYEKIRKDAKVVKDCEVLHLILSKL